MTTTVTTKNMITIPAAVARIMSIRPGCRLEWRPVEGTDEIRVRVIPDRGEAARRLLGTGRAWSPDVDAVDALVQERESDG